MQAMKGEEPQKEQEKKEISTSKTEFSTDFDPSLPDDFMIEEDI